MTAGEVTAPSPTWSIADHLSILDVYSLNDGVAFAPDDGWTGSLFGRVARADHPDDEDGLIVIQPNSRLDPTVVEVAVSEGEALELAYRLEDPGVGSVEIAVAELVDDEVATLVADHLDQGGWVRRTLRVRPSCTLRLTVRQADVARVAVAARPPGEDAAGRPERRHTFSYEGQLGVVQVSLRGSGALTPTAGRSGQPAPGRAEPTPPHVHEFRAGYDTAFVDGRPTFSFGTKATGDDTHRIVRAVGGNVYSIEGPQNELVNEDWSWNDDILRILDENIRRCAEHGLVYKTLTFEAHCNPYLPTWAMDKHDLYQEFYDEAGNNIRPKRRKIGYYCCFLKPETRRVHTRLAGALAARYRGQPVVYTMMAEPQLSEWLCECGSCVDAWRSWLAQRFAGVFEAFTHHVGGVSATDFDDVPYLHGYEPSDRFGYPMRALHLRMQFSVESYCRYIDDLGAAVKAADPDAVLCQRGTVWPATLSVAKLSRTDYSYALSNLIYNPRNVYGVGAKPWYGLYGHFGALPTPKQGSIGKSVSAEIANTVLTEEEWRQVLYTLVANGACGAEFTPLLDAWSWGKGASLVDQSYRLTRQGRRARETVGEIQQLAPSLQHYERSASIAILHNELGRDPLMFPELTESKVGAYGLVRELGYHADGLIEQDVEAGRLSEYRLLLLIGDLSLSPWVQQRIREFVAAGGWVLAAYEPHAGGFPGCNSYDYAGPQKTSVAERSFASAEGAAHLGDLLGIASGGGFGGHSRIVAKQECFGLRPGEPVTIDDLRAVLDGKHGSHENSSADTLSLLPGAEALAWFDDPDDEPTPAVVRRRYGQGQAITVGFCPGLVAGNTYNDGVFTMLRSIAEAARCRRAVWAAPAATQIGYNAMVDRPWRVECGAWHDDAGGRTVVAVNHDRDLESEGWLHIASRDGGHGLFPGRSVVDPQADEVRLAYRIGPWDAEAWQSVAAIESDVVLAVRCERHGDEVDVLIRSAEPGHCAIRPHAVDWVEVDGQRCPLGPRREVELRLTPNVSSRISMHFTRG